MESHPQQNRDAADYVEASREAELPPDSLQDQILEVLQQGGDNQQIAKRLVNMLAAGSESAMDEELLKKKASQFRELLKVLAPPKGVLVQWYAMHFALGTESVRDMTHDELARIIGIDRSSISWWVRKWQTQLKAIGVEIASTKSQEVHVGHRKRRK